MKTSEKNNHDTQQEEKKEPSRQGGCVAYHCPLDATMFNSAVGGQGHCRYHHNAPAEEWAEITRALRKNIAVVRYLYKIRRLTPVEFHQQRPVFEMMRLPLEPGESQFRYIRRIDNWIHQRIKDALAESTQ